MYCSLCKDESEEESEVHLLKCSKIIDEIKVNTINVKYEDIFNDDIEAQVTIVKLFSQVLKARKLLLNRMQNY